MADCPRNLVLIGYRGSGKTTIGRRVAERLGYAFVDTDERIVVDAGMTIAEVFEKEGESGFRKREARAVRETAAGSRQVISAGGGAVLASENVRQLRAGGFVVWLTAPPEILWRRIAGDAGSSANRPALSSLLGLDEVRAVLADREPLYRSTANAVVDTTAGNLERIADAVRSAYNLAEGSSEG